MLVPSHDRHLPLRYMIREVWLRYRRPLFIAETGIEADARPKWLRYVGRESRAAIGLGVPLEGICLYPVVDHPGWEDDRHCPNGLWNYPDDQGRRGIYEPLARELTRQQRLHEGLEAPEHPGPAAPEGDPEVLEEEELAVLDVAAVDLNEVTVKSREGSAGR